jgi:CheY-like chemotaxis protein
MDKNGIALCLLKPIRKGELLDALIAVTLDEETLPSRGRVSGSEPPTAAAAEGAKLLLAEDNLVNQKVALKQLHKLGYKADVVNNGKEALEALERTHYSLVLMDCHMPELDGYEATARIREAERMNPGKERIRIIAMTADAMHGDREKCMAIGMDDYIAKPVRIEQLKALLEKHLREKVGK